MIHHGILSPADLPPLYHERKSHTTTFPAPSADFLVSGVAFAGEGPLSWKKSFLEMILFHYRGNDPGVNDGVIEHWLGRPV
jgi:hypothetical protein